MWGLHPVDGKDLYALVNVLIGGLLGGALYAFTDESKPNFWVATFAGAIAAGISIFVLAGTDTNNVLRLIFFAVVSGYSYPIILKAARDSIVNRSGSAEPQLKAAKAQAKVAPKQAADTLKAVFSVNAAIDVDKNRASAIANAARDTVATIAAGVGDKIAAGVGDKTEAQVSSAIDSMKSIGNAATQAGYIQVTNEVINQLKSLSKGDLLNTVKSDIKSAIKDVNTIQSL